MPVYVDPPAPQIGSITAGGQTLSGSTFDDNTSTATELSFNITGAISGATVSVYVDGDATPIATGTVSSGATTITVTTDGTTKIAHGSHEFTVEQSLATDSADLLANWTTNLSGQLSPGTEFSIAASTVQSPASSGTALTIGLAVTAHRLVMPRWACPTPMSSRPTPPAATR